MGGYNLGEMIQVNRIQQGMSLADLADEICAVETLTRIELGYRTPRKRHMKS